MAKGGTRRWGWAFLIGLAGTAAVLAGKLAGLDERAELAALDVRLRQAVAPMPADTPLLYVEIDDGSIERVGRWPWPRETLAGLVATLNACGAQTVALDIILPDPQPVRYVHAAAELYDPSAEALFDAPPTMVFDDAALARALAEGNVFLPFHLDVHAAPAPTGSLQARVAEAVRTAPEASLVKLQKTVTDATDAATRAAVRRAYLLEHGRLAMRRFALRAEGCEALGLPAGPITPPLVLFGRAVLGSGFVNIQPDADGTVRRVNLLGRSGGAVYPQLAVSLANDLDSLPRHHTAAVTCRESELHFALPDGKGTFAAPVDTSGAMLLRWHELPAERRIPAAAVVHVWQEARRVERLEALAHGLRIKLLSMGLPPESLQADFADLAELTDRADEAYRRRIELQRSALRELLYEPGSTVARRALPAVRQAEEQLDKRLRKKTAVLLGKLTEPEVFQAFLRLPESEARAVLDKLDRVQREQQAVRVNSEQLFEELSARVLGSVCLIGSTSTGAADFVPTPLHPRTPGVRVHGNALLTMRDGGFIRQVPPVVNLLELLLAGAAAGLLASTRPIIQAAVATAVLAAAYVAGNLWLIFGQWGYWLDVVAPLAAILGSFLAVTVYRQLTEERAKRRIRNMFAHALSGPLVDQLIEDPALVEARNRPITCMFTDLAGFTPLSGRLGPAGTVRLLHRYFDCVTDVVQHRWGGYLNKFLGDGVLAIFGAPVDQEDHTTRAVRAAVEYQAEVAKLNDSLREEFGEAAALSVRIGLTAHDAMVGDCGSSERMDYTAIGECVNLAARLEAANKYFGSAILLDDVAWRACRASDVQARSLGRARITGIAEPVELVEVLGPSGPVEARRAEVFAELLDRLGRGEVEACCELLGEHLREDPYDKAAEVYLRHCHAAKQAGGPYQPPAEQAKGVERIIWPGAKH